MLLRYWCRLYQNMTESERALEPSIAALGERYRAQHPFFGLKLIADFALLDRKLIIEVDGNSHDRPAQKKKDLQHMIALKALGWDVVRVTNEQAQAVPAETVAAALARTPQTASQLGASLEQLLRDYPELAVEPPKRPRKKRRPRKAAGAAGKSGGAGRRRKQPAA